MSVNMKKPLRLLNNTKYFNPESSKLYNTFGSPSTYQSRRIKIEGYETRLYWQYRYCDEHNGQTFFYTLTYNDAHIPKPYGFNCFDYEDLRDLLTGGFRKQLLRKYGTIFKYFIGAELGDGKGERGMHNNPHYHILFFLEPANNPRYPYEKISSEDFRHLVRTYWQGFDEDEDKKKGVFHDYREAKYGIAREGDNIGLVTDFRACMYAAKYVCKDVKLKEKERVVENAIRSQVRKNYKHTKQSLIDFFNEEVCSFYNADNKYNPVELLNNLIPGFEVEGVSQLTDKDIVCACWRIIRDYELQEDYHRFVRKRIEERTHERFTEYLNRYCNKCRISQKVGDYALDFIDDELNPAVKVPSKKGFKNRPLSMYYYRKLFTKVITDETGSNIRVLNDLGIQYKLSRLEAQISKKALQGESILNLVISNPTLYNRILESDLNDSRYFLSYADFLKNWNYLLENNNKEEILRRYAEFKLVYEDRFFPCKNKGSDRDIVFPWLDVIGDYASFLYPTIYYTTRSDTRVSAFLHSGCEGYLSYSVHPYFSQCTRIFDVLDLCTDYFFVQGDDKAQREAEEIAAVKRFHTLNKVKEFYSNFR